MKRFNKMTERQMTKSNGGVAIFPIACGAAVAVGTAIGVGCGFIGWNKPQNQSQSNGRSAVEDSKY